MLRPSRRQLLSGSDAMSARPQSEKLVKSTKGQAALGLVYLLIFLAAAGALIYFLLVKIGPTLSSFFAPLSGLDSAVIVALITGTVSVVSLVGGSVVNSVMKKNEYLREHREEPYMRLISLLYDFQAAAGKGEEISEDELRSILTQFNKELTLWGSSKAIKVWGKWRTVSSRGSVNPHQVLFEMEKVMIQLRKDMGMRRGLGKGDLLRLTVNDIDSFLESK